MASRIRSERVSLSSKQASIRSSVPAGRRAGICSKFICLRPILLISPIDGIKDITYIDDINNGSKAMGLGYQKSQRHKATDRKVVQRLRDHADFMARFQAQGMSRDDASKEAALMVKAGVKPDPKQNENDK